MLKRNLWKLTISFIIVLWAVFELQPLKDQPFVGFAKTQTTANFLTFFKPALTFIECTNLEYIRVIPTFA